MEKKLITEMKFMMERLENPRLTYTEYEKKHKLLTEDSEMDPHKKPKLYELTSFRDFITTLVTKVNRNHMFDLKKLESMFNDGGNSVTLYSPGFMNKENTIFKLGNGDLYELTPDTNINSSVPGKTVVSPTKINQLPSWAELLN